MRSHRFHRRLLAALALALAPTAAAAESWCAYPLWVHEWGVHVFASDGAPAAAPALPTYFHSPGQAQAASASTPVRQLPADSGIRTLPVMHFYSAGTMSSPIPVGLEVGFTQGAASAWYPAVDLRRPAALANGPAAAGDRGRLLAMRAARGSGRTPDGVPADLAPDPTRQLVWDRIELTPAPKAKPAPAELPWVEEVRGFGALWANARGESERFVFYEAGTAERTPLALLRGDTYAPGRRHYVLENRGGHAVFDVFFVHREAGRLYVFFAPQIPAGKSAGFLVEDHLVKDDGSETSARLRALLVDPATPEAPKEYRWGNGDCVMMRDPAVPTEKADGYRLYGSEVTAILHVWEGRFFGQGGTTVLYREDAATLDQVMPLSIYTDMFNFVVLNRAGLALWENVKLP